MRGVAYDPVFRAKLMALHQQGVPLTTLSTEFGVAREVLGRWWARHAVGDLAALTPRSRRPERSPTRLSTGMERRTCGSAPNDSSSHAECATSLDSRAA